MKQFSAGKCSISQKNLLQYFKNEILMENVSDLKLKVCFVLIFSLFHLSFFPMG